MVSEEIKQKMGTLREPGYITQGMMLLEDVGIAKPLNGTQYDFDQAMNHIEFGVPEILIWAGVLLTAVITVLGLIGK
ncbi:Uncharacterised protein [uncultured archaeon]|nr:Uncharacterised protein [uncultured archaeon]